MKKINTQIHLSSLENFKQFKRKMPSFDGEFLPYGLQSYFYVQGERNVEFVNWLKPKVGQLIIDSGAFSYMNALKNGKNTKEPDWNSYIDSYCEFINTYKFDKFMELDLGVLMPYSDVLDIRKKIETKTGKQVIPVWHEYLGLPEFQNMLKEYHYVAVGGIVTKEIVTSVDYLCDLAHDHGNVIHGLGYTPVKRIVEHSLPFDTVDSSAWTSGARFGGSYEYTKDEVIRNKRHIQPYAPHGQAVNVLYNDYLIWKNLSINYPLTT